MAIDESKASCWAGPSSDASRPSVATAPARSGAMRREAQWGTGWTLHHRGADPVTRRALVWTLAG